jgi:hypothetical protein
MIVLSIIQHAELLVVEAIGTRSYHLALRG